MALGYLLADRSHVVVRTAMNTAAEQNLASNFGGGSGYSVDGRAAMFCYFVGGFATSVPTFPSCNLTTFLDLWNLLHFTERRQCDRSQAGMSLVNRIVFSVRVSLKICPWVLRHLNVFDRWLVQIVVVKHFECEPPWTSNMRSRLFCQRSLFFSQQFFWMHPLKARTDLVVIHHPTYLLIFVNKSLPLSGYEKILSRSKVCLNTVCLDMSLFQLIRFDSSPTRPLRPLFFK